jgi:hypothetical protein
MPDYVVDESSITNVAVEGLNNLYVMSNPSLEVLLFDRGLIGLPFSRACLESSKAFLRHFRPELSPLLSDVAELMILTKGAVYRMHDAFEQVFDINLPVNFIATRRAEVTSATAQIEIPYYNFDAPSENLIIGDVVATGATLCAALSSYQHFQNLKRIFVFSLAGSLIGAKTLHEFCESKGIELTVVYALGVFGLGENGFDLSFLHPETITSPEYRRRAAEAFRDLPISAVGWDCGTQTQAPRKYKMLCWLEAKYWGLKGNDVFPEKEFPNDARLVEKERSAYGSKISIGDNT